MPFGNITCFFVIPTKLPTPQSFALCHPSSVSSDLHLGPEIGLWRTLNTRGPLVLLIPLESLYTLILPYHYRIYSGGSCAWYWAFLTRVRPESWEGACPSAIGEVSLFAVFPIRSWSHVWHDNVYDPRRWSVAFMIYQMLLHASKGNSSMRSEKFSRA